MAEFIASLHQRTVLRHPLASLLVLLAMLAALMPGLRNFKLDASTDALLLESDRALSDFRQLAIRYKVRDFLFIAVVPPDDILAPATLALLSDLRDEIAAVAGVRDVVTLLDVPLLSSFDGQFADVALNFETLRSRGIDA